MYNCRFPSWEVAASLEGGFSGNLAYAYAKRGQVLLCERWAEEHPKVKFVSCHPGWTATLTLILTPTLTLTLNPEATLTLSLTLTLTLGWTATPAVDAAYGDMKRYLEPMRSPWQVPLNLTPSP